MNSNNKKWRNAGLYTLLAIVVIALGTALLDKQPAAKEVWKYSRLISEVRGGKVETVRLSADRSRALVVAQDGSQVLSTCPTTLN